MRRIKWSLNVNEIETQIPKEMGGICKLPIDMYSEGSMVVQWEVLPFHSYRLPDSVLSFGFLSMQSCNPSVPVGFLWLSSQFQKTCN